MPRGTDADGSPAGIGYPGRVPPGNQSNDVVHITDIFTTLLAWSGAEPPKDRVIDGVDQRALLEGKQPSSARDGFPFWMGETLYGVKWRNFKMVMYMQRSSLEPG